MPTPGGGTPGNKGPTVEGVFIPGLADNSLDGSGEGQGYSVQVGRYVKIGRIVHFQLHLDVSDLGTLSTGQGANVVGLPFTAANISNSFAPVYVGFANSLAMSVLGMVVTGYVSPDTAHIILKLWDATGGVTDLLISEYSAGGALVIGGSYEV